RRVAGHEFPLVPLLHEEVQPQIIWKQETANGIRKSGNLEICEFRIRASDRRFDNYWPGNGDNQRQWTKFVNAPTACYPCKPLWTKTLTILIDTKPGGSAVAVSGSVNPYSALRSLQ